jgi:hypothetical protein
MPSKQQPLRKSCRAKQGNTIMQATKAYTYITKAGKIGAEVLKQSNGAYRYMGAWGAGCVNAETMHKTMQQWEQTKRGFTKETHNQG